MALALASFAPLSVSTRAAAARSNGAAGAAPRLVALPSRRPLPPLARKPCAPAAAVAAAEVAAEVVWEATGVPLVDVLMKCKTVEAAAQFSIKLVAASVGAVMLGSLIFSLLDKMTGGKLAESSGKGGFNPAAAVVASTLKPAQALLPFYGIAYSTTVVSALVQVAAIKMKPEFAAMCRGYNEEVLGAIKWATQLIQDTSELILIIGAAWAAIDFKNRVLAWLEAWLSSGSEGDSRAFITQLMNPISAVLSALITIAAGMAALSAFGINVGPLVASVGGLGLAIGLAMQSLAGNVVSALSLYTGRPFVVGDRVQLTSPGGGVVEGEVVVIEPLRTILRDNSGAPVYLSNSDVTACVIRNISQSGKQF
ncbi:mechanosensitive ion channel [Micractinium conductrix]|uniref:Mechanosensitive ion channel n=1 Tax=Micractinium conductrix TaxID=554055 RepID=A0A2P6VEA4_9CHLO|nr:mechanosensitive ion channel [Micractinium conductrix]|eukprot:PSC72397.1 mechanosensitive ion channel [Micractinium conductrix]